MVILKTANTFERNILKVEHFHSQMSFATLYHVIKPRRGFLFSKNLTNHDFPVYYSTHFQSKTDLRIISLGTENTRTIPTNLKNRTKSLLFLRERNTGASARRCDGIIITY